MQLILILLEARVAAARIKITREDDVRAPVGGRGVLTEKLDGSVRPTSQNHYSIYDQNLRFLLPYLWPKIR